MEFTANRLLAGAVLALSLCCGTASAQVYVPPPTPNEAHAFLADAFRRYLVEYTLWYGAGTRDHYRGRVLNYGGQDCYSQVDTGHANRAFAVDWSKVSAVELSGAEAVYVSGQLMHVAQNPDTRHYANFHMYFPDTRLTRSVANAFSLLRTACQQRSRFD
jgi:hypothetical protein